MQYLREWYQGIISSFEVMRFTPMNAIEIVLIAVVVYYIIEWIKNNKVLVILKGMLVLLLFYMVASILEFDVIKWIFQNALGLSITALIILFQPELRKGLEQLGKRNIVTPFLSQDENVFTDHTVDELVDAVFSLAKERTGALIVIERSVKLDEAESTGISLDAKISSELIMNIFQNKFPLHDGAIIIRGNRVAAATCYLPLSENYSLSKDLGTRHRAAVGISEVSDSVTIVVSEETGGISIAENGELTRRVGRELLYDRLKELQNSTDEQDKKVRKKLFGKDRENA
ncbi:MAG: diadenylate cyclase CdaA [Lachnospiraceae bacterium]|nr:diadenylate cyclase CdaA [Lachnospiraceae bacterium]